MARKKKHEKEPNHERWLVSYADFITLLFAVFVTLYAMSQTDKKKVEQVITSLRESFGLSSLSGGSAKPAVLPSMNMSIIPSISPEAIKPAPRMRGVKSEGKGRGKAVEKDFTEIKTSLEAYLMMHGANEEVSISINQRGLVVSLKEAGFFDSGSAVIKQSSMPILGRVIEALAAYDNQFRVEGHTDNIPIRTASFKSNWELSTTRATNLVHYMINNYSFDPSKISAAGFGEFRPVADNGSGDGRAKNRRVDVVMLSLDAERSEP
jgi:chemotaxis protein MotB